MCFDSRAENSPMSRNESTWCSGITSRCTGACGLRSSIATKPLVWLTYSPSRTRRQKRQSSCDDGKDALLPHGGGPHADELADGRFEQERRVVVAVAAP